MKRRGKNAVAGELGDVPVRAISLEDVITNKRASGRPKDLLDVQALEDLHGSRRR